MSENSRVNEKEAESARTGMNEIVRSRGFADSIVLLARKKADVILENARAEAEKIKADARKESFRKGLDEGRKQGILEGHMELKNELEQVKSRMKSLEKQFEDKVLNMLENLMPRIRELILALVQNILKREIHDDSDLVIRTIKGAARSMIQRDKVQLSVHYAEIDEVIKKREEIIASSDMIKDLEISAGEEADRGGAVITSSSGIIDARIKSQLEVAGEIINN